MNSITKSTSANKTRSADNNNAERQGINGMNLTSNLMSPMGTVVDHLNIYQKMHLQGTFNVYEPIPQETGEPLPPLAVQWKEDAKRRWGKNENTGNR